METRISIAIRMLPSATKQQMQAVRESRNRNRDENPERCTGDTNSELLYNN